MQISIEKMADACLEYWQKIDNSTASCIMYDILEKCVAKDEMYPIETAKVDVKSLAEQAEKHPNSIYKALGNLAESGWIIKKTKGSYAINIPKMYVRVQAEIKDLYAGIDPENHLDFNGNRPYKSDQKTPQFTKIEAPKSLQNSEFLGSKLADLCEKIGQIEHKLNALETQKTEELGKLSSFEKYSDKNLEDKKDDIILYNTIYNNIYNNIIPEIKSIIKEYNENNNKVIIDTIGKLLNSIISTDKDSSLTAVISSSYNNNSYSTAVIGSNINNLEEEKKDKIDSRKCNPSGLHFPNRGENIENAKKIALKKNEVADDESETLGNETLSDKVEIVPLSEFSQEPNDETSSENLENDNEEPMPKYKKHALQKRMALEALEKSLSKPRLRPGQKPKPMDEIEEEEDDEFTPVVQARYVPVEQPIVSNENQWKKVDAYDAWKQEKDKYPFFPADEVMKCANDLRYCLDEADKVFIYKFWRALSDMVGDEIIQDGEYVGIDLNIDGRMIPADTFNRLLQDVMEETYNIIRSGQVEEEIPDGDTLDLECDMDSAGFKYIVDFECYENEHGEQYYKISSERFHRPNAEPLYDDESPVRKAIREKAERDKAYAEEIVKLGDKDETYDQLTPIEQFVYDILDGNYEITEQGRIMQNNNQYVSRQILMQMWQEKYNALGVGKHDIIKVTRLGRSGEHGELLLDILTFSSDNIIQWNENNGYRANIFD